MDMLIIKKFVAAYFMPMPMCILLLLLALVFLLLKRIRTGIAFTVAATLLLFISGTGLISNQLLRPLEQQYPQFDLSRPVDTIAILGCGHTNDAQLPLTAQLQPCSLYRVAEAVRIYRQNPRAQIIVSGGAIVQPFTTAEMHKRMLVALGVPDSAISMHLQPQDTEQEVEVLAPQLRGHNAALVTSASHLPRAMALFARHQVTPIPAPAEYLVKQSEQQNITHFAPSTINILKLERWWYETLSHTWIGIKHWFE